MLYVKEGIHYKHRNDLELRNIESIWIEVANSHERVLVGLFYRPLTLMLLIFQALRIQLA